MDYFNAGTENYTFGLHKKLIVKASCMEMHDQLKSLAWDELEAIAIYNYVLNVVNATLNNKLNLLSSEYYQRANVGLGYTYRQVD